jgi:c-di-GMP phosphodiesterase
MTNERRGAVVDAFIARQPIFDRRGELYAYELLYRANAVQNRAEGATAETMASDVLSQAFLGVGVERLTGGAKAFVNFPRELLLEGVYQVLDPSRVVIELLETVSPDAAVIAACRELHARGYTLALDDFVFGPEYVPLLEIAQVVKLDVLNKATEDLASSVQQLAPFRQKLLAERVETPAVRDACESLGFELFQGYFFSRPEILTQRDLSPGHLTIFRLMNLVRDPEASDQQLENAFRGDMGLTVKLLRTVNSAAMGGSGIESIRHAIRLTGRAELQKWLAVLLVASVAKRGGTTAELVQTAIVRARMCELLALAAGKRALAGSLFMVGLLSLLDAILQSPLEDLVNRINLAPEVRGALLDRDGPLASTLALVEAYERGSWTALSAHSWAAGIDVRDVPDLFVEALEWGRDRLRDAE